MSEDPKQDPPPQENPTHDVPVYPEQDPPAETQQPIKAGARGPAGGPSERERHREGQSEGSKNGEGEEDVDEDDLDPQVPHSPPDAKKGRIVFDENKVTG